MFGPLFGAAACVRVRGLLSRPSDRPSGCGLTRSVRDVARVPFLTPRARGAPQPSARLNSRPARLP